MATPFEKIYDNYSPQFFQHSLIFLHQLGNFHILTYIGIETRCTNKSN